MKHFFQIFFIWLLICASVAVYLGTQDDAFAKVYVSKNIFEYFFNSIAYFYLWVLPYMWLVIISVSLIGATISTIMLKYFFKTN